MKFRFISIDQNTPGHGIKFGLVWLTIFSILALTACHRADPVVALSGETMGTTWSVKVISDDADADFLKDGLKKDIDDRLVALNDVFSTYIPESELSVLNASSGPLEISDELANVLEVSQAIFALSDGAFDVTVGPLVNLWGFGSDGPRHGVPTQDQIDAAMGRIGFSRVQIEDGMLTKPADLVIDLSAVAKGYAVDAVAELLEARGSVRYLVEIGGEVKTRGQNDRDQPWIIGIEAPDMEMRRLFGTIPVSDHGMATSGDYRNFFEHEGQYYSHSLNPATGWPVTHHLASVTVLHESAAYADGLATAFSVLGLDRTMTIAEANNLKVFAIIRDEGDFKSVTSGAMNQYLVNSQ